MLRGMAVTAIRASRLTKDYGIGRGLFDLELEVSPQEVFGYLGPNGAGKTTTIRCLMGMIRPSSGTAHIFGLDCRRDSVAVKRKVGYLPGDIPQFGSLRGKEVVAYLGGIRGGVDQKTVRSIAERFDLDLGRRFREYSSGNKQKLGILLAFMHQPELLILDEPTRGLDPLNQQEFYALLLAARDGGATVFLSSLRSSMSATESESSERAGSSRSRSSKTSSTSGLTGSRSSSRTTPKSLRLQSGPRPAWKT